MATYVIGDIHGAYQTLMNLLDAISFEPGRDQLWLVGDLVNNGPRSADVLRWAKEHDAHLTAVLGNHDLHLLAVDAGARGPRGKDTFGDVLAAPDRGELLEWLRHRPVMHREGYDVMIHAGLLPQWDLELAESCARELEQALRGSAHGEFFHDMYGNKPRVWREDLSEVERMRLTVNALTRMRVIDARGRLEFKYKSTLGAMPEALTPWFEARQAELDAARVFFGHWSALGYHEHGPFRALDSGATWGRELTAYRLEDDRRFSVPTAPGEASPRA